jgi:predicted glycoside hydrolase/deacetylase ChbG (UPF0249 family)
MDEILRRKITVAADDYGIRETAGSILELAQKKRLDRVAVFSERVTDDDMRALLETGVAIDIHLELIRLLKTGQEDEGSALSRGMNFFFRRIFGVVNQRKVQGEWRRQIILFRDRFGRLPDGLNSHEHVHYFPEFFSVAVDLAQEFGISRVRLGSEGMAERYGRGGYGGQAPPQGYGQAPGGAPQMPPQGYGPQRPPTRRDDDPPQGTPP